MMSENALRVYEFLYHNYEEIVTAEDISRELNMSLPAVTGVVNGLVKKGKALRDEDWMLDQFGSCVLMKHISLTRQGYNEYPEDLHRIKESLYMGLKSKNHKTEIDTFSTPTKESEAFSRIILTTQVRKKEKKHNYVYIGVDEVSLDVPNIAAALAAVQTAKKGGELLSYKIIGKDKNNTWCTIEAEGENAFTNATSSEPPTIVYKTKEVIPEDCVSIEVAETVAKTIVATTIEAMAASVQDMVLKGYSSADISNALTAAARLENGYIPENFYSRKRLFPIFKDYSKAIIQSKFNKGD